MSSVRDVMVTAVVLLVMGMFLLIGNFVGTTINNNMKKNVPQINQSAITVEVLDNVNIATGKFDYIFLGIFIGLIAAVIITGWLFLKKKLSWAKPIFIQEECRWGNLRVKNYPEPLMK